MHTDKPKFTFELIEQGVAHATFAYRGRLVDYQPTNVCNAIGDLLSGLAQLITNPTYLWGEDAQQTITWFNDETSLNWVFTMCDDHTVTVRLCSSDGFFEEDQVELLNLDCDFLELIFSIISELDAQIKSIGLLNYQQLWQKNEFPITYFLFLKKYLIERSHWHQMLHNKCDILSDELLLLLA